MRDMSSGLASVEAKKRRKDLNSSIIRGMNTVNRPYAL